MNRLNQAFLVVVVALTLLGGGAAADYSQTLGDLDDAGLIKDQIENRVVDGGIEDGEFVVTVEIRNPTRFSLDLNGAYAVVNDEGTRITYGTIVNHDAIPETIPPKDSVTVTYRFALSDDQEQRLQQALDEGSVEVVGKHSVQLHETKFSVSFAGEVEGR